MISKVYTWYILIVKAINRVVEKLLFPAMIACLSMDLSDVHGSINMPRSYTMPISASEHLCGVEAFLHQFLLLASETLSDLFNRKFTIIVRTYVRMSQLPFDL